MDVEQPEFSDIVSELLIKVSIFLSFDLSTIILAISHIKKIILALFIISLNWNHPRWSDMHFSYSLGFENSFSSVQFSSVAQWCPTLCDPMKHSTPSLPVHHQLPEPTQTHVHWVMMPSNHLILCRPLLLPPSMFPSIGVFSNESVLPIRWPKYWSFSFSISPSNEYSGLISFRMDRFDLLAV